MMAPDRESSYHCSSDIDQYASCLPDTWNTPISSFLKMKPPTLLRKSTMLYY